MCVSVCEIWTYRMCPHNVKNILEMSKCAIIDVNMKFLVKHGKILTDINSKKRKMASIILVETHRSCIPRVCPLPQSYVSHAVGHRLKVKIPSTACPSAILSPPTPLLPHLPIRLLLNQHIFPWVFPRSQSHLCSLQPSNYFSFSYSPPPTTIWCNSVLRIASISRKLPKCFQSELTSSPIHS